jgi:exodeoxyribonuclease-5
MQLNQGQQKIHDAAVHWFNHESSQLFEITGAAGVGKSVLIFEILRSLGLRPNQYLAMAYTGQAAIVMRTKGFPSARSIHSSLYEVVEEVDDSNISKHFGVAIKKKYFRKKRFVSPDIVLFFIDEAYMVPDYMVKDIMSFGIKVIVCGDSNQLPPVGGNPGFLTGNNVYRLTEIMRQQANDPIVYLSHRVLNGLPIHNGLYGNSVLVINEDEFDPRMYGLVDVVCACSNKKREEINTTIRQMCGYTSPLPYFGERIICRQNNWNIEIDGISLANGLQGYAYGSQVLNPNNPKTFFMDFKPDMTNYVFPQIEMNIEYFSAPRDVKEDMKSMVKSQRYRIVPGELFEYAYACTAWILQGGEFPRVLFMEEFTRFQDQRPLVYTSITRAKQKLIYVKQKINKYYPGNNFSKK